MLYLIPLFPLLGFVVNAALGKRLPKAVSGLLATGAMLFSFIVSFDNVPVSIFLLGAGQMTLPVKIFTAIEYGVDPSIAAISTMLIVVTGLGLAAAERWVGFHRFV